MYKPLLVNVSVSPIVSEVQPRMTVVTFQIFILNCYCLINYCDTCKGR